MEKNLKAKKTVNIVINVVLWVFVAFCLFVTIIAVSASANAKNVPTVGGKCFLNVQSDSMNAKKPDGVPDNKPSGFGKGNLLVSNYIATSDSAIDALEVGDIITFEYDIDGDGRISKGEYNTHRITEIERNKSGRIVSVKTMGDNVEFSRGHEETVRRDAIIAVYTGTRVAGLGSVLHLPRVETRLRALHSSASRAVLRLPARDVHPHPDLRQERRQEGHYRRG